MRFSVGHKQKIREKILGSASQRFRRAGFAACSVDALMGDVGLTAGGFYAHFASKQSLFNLAMDRAFADSRALLAKNLPETGGPARLTAFCRNYLSRLHRDSITEGCAFPTSGADAVRAPPTTRKVFERNLLAVLELVQERPMEAMAPAEREVALGSLATCIGGLLLARCVQDAGFSDQILQICRAFLKSHNASEPRPEPGKDA